MSDIEWIKLDVNFFSNRKVKQIMKRPDGDTIIVIWLKFLCLAGSLNDGGLVYLTPEVPYTEKMLAIEFGVSEKTAKTAIEILKNFKMIEKIGEIFHICGWNKHQNIEGMERVREKTRQRVATYRERKRLENGAFPEKEDAESNATNENVTLHGNVTCNVTRNVTKRYSNAIESERESESEIEGESEKESDTDKKDISLDSENSNLLTMDISILRTDNNIDLEKNISLEKQKNNNIINNKINNHGKDSSLLLGDSKGGRSVSTSKQTCNVTNFEKYLEKSQSEVWDTLRADTPLTDIIRTWLEYKDGQHEYYKNEVSMTTLCKKFIRAKNEAGYEALTDAVETAISACWKGIVWDRIKEPASSGKTGSRKINWVAQELDEFYQMAADWASRDETTSQDIFMGGAF